MFKKFFCSNDGPLQLSFDEILTCDPNAVKLLNKELKNNGWCFVEFNNDMAKSIKNINDIVYDFLKNNNYDKKYNIDENFGYIEKHFKRGFRILTGDMLETRSKYYPLPIKKELIDFSENMDKIVSNLLYKTFCPKVYDKDLSELNENKDICIMNKPSFGMLDFAYYYNNAISNNKPDQAKINVHEHTDAGLFSVHFGSNIPGLQFYDRIKKKWIDVPLNVGVIFCGNRTLEITDGNIKSANHRVLHSKKEFDIRFSSWYEICVESQISLPSKNADVDNDNKDAYNDKDKKMSIVVVGKSNEKIKVPGLTGNSKIGDVFSYVEEIWGIPSGKSAAGLNMLSGNLFFDKKGRNMAFRDKTLNELGLKDGGILYLY